jgi:hypothetical protein
MEGMLSSTTTSCDLAVKVTGGKRFSMQIAWPPLILSLGIGRTHGFLSIYSPSAKLSSTNKYTFYLSEIL